MAWTDIHGHALAKRIWQAHLAADTVSNAYLLAGPEGIGKRLLAREMAKALNCPGVADRPCDRCATCAQITKQIHPDVHWLGPEGIAGSIKLEAVRQVLGRIALRPFSVRYQVVIIDGAERMTEEAANSLLKSLEEPPAHTRFLLLSAQRSRCLPTIVSRCQLIRCQRLSPEAVETILISRTGCDAATASAIARLAGGSAAHAVALVGRWPAYQRLLDRLNAQHQSTVWLETPLPDTRDEVQHLLDGMTLWLRDVTVDSEGAVRVDRDRCVETAVELVRLRESLEQFVSPRLVAALAREHWLALLSPS